MLEVDRRYGRDHFLEDSVVRQWGQDCHRLLKVATRQARVFSSAEKGAAILPYRLWSGNLQIHDRCSLRRQGSMALAISQWASPVLHPPSTLYRRFDPRQPRQNPGRNGSSCEDAGSERVFYEDRLRLRMSQNPLHRIGRYRVRTHMSVFRRLLKGLCGNTRSIAGQCRSQLSSLCADAGGGRWTHSGQCLDQN